MINKLTEIIIYKMIEENVIASEDFDIHFYGLNLILISIFEIGVLITLSLLTGAFVEMIVFLLYFTILRSYSGGFHAKTITRCLMTSLSFSLMSIYSYYYLFQVALGNGFVLINLISLGLLLLFAPTANKNRPISEAERIHFRKLSLLVYGIEVLLLLVLVYLNIYPAIVHVGTVTILLQSLTLINMDTLKSKFFT